MEEQGTTRELAQVLGISDSEARGLLERTGGRVDRAADLYFTGGGPQQPNVDEVTAEAAQTEAGGAEDQGVVAGSADETVGGASTHKGQKRPSAAPGRGVRVQGAKKVKGGAPGPGSIGLKRKAPTGGKGKGGKGKTEGVQQPSITSFFGARHSGATSSSDYNKPQTQQLLNDAKHIGDAQIVPSSDAGEPAVIDIDAEDEVRGDEEEKVEGEERGAAEDVMEAVIAVLTTGPDMSAAEAASADAVTPVELKAGDYGGSVGSPVDRVCARYDPVKDACWKRGEPAPYIHMAWAFELLCATTKRIQKADILVNMFRSLMALDPDSVVPAVFMSSNKLSSSFESVDTRIGGSIVSGAIMQATGCNKERIRQLYLDTGDIGDVAQALRVKQRMLIQPKPLTVSGVYNSIIDLANIQGQGCDAKKEAVLVRLIRSCRGPETRYLVRTFIQHIRTGATLVSVLAALAMASVYHHMPPGSHRFYSTMLVAGMKTPVADVQKLDLGVIGSGGLSKSALQAQLTAAQEAVKESFSICPDIPRIARALVEGGIEHMKVVCKPQVGIPVKYMLAKICNGIQDMLDKFGNTAFSCEYKYDGQRAQVHILADGTVKLYNRQIQDMTDKYPDVVHLMQEIKASHGDQLVDAILDTELVAVDRAQKNKILPFQSLSTRGRKDVKRDNVTVAVCVFHFDLLHLNGEPWVQRPFADRRKKLYELMPERPGVIGPTMHLESNDLSEISAFFNEAIDNSCEGVMCKALEGEKSHYEPDKRTDSWLKLKKDYISDLHDSLDLVPIGAWYGNGRKVGWFSPILMAAYDPDTEELQSVCRCMSGFTDAFYEELTRFYKDGRILQSPRRYMRTDDPPQVWFEPTEVWEIRGAELTISPVHKAAAGMLDPTKGLSLRFPRFIRKRDDKAVEDATTAQQIVDMFRLQARRPEIKGEEKQTVKEPPGEDGEGDVEGKVDEEDYEL